MDSDEFDCNGVESDEGFSLLEKPTDDADETRIADPSDLKFTDIPLSPANREKAEKIRNYLETTKRPSVERLREFAISEGGLVSGKSLICKFELAEHFRLLGHHQGFVVPIQGIHGLWCLVRVLRSPDDARRGESAWQANKKQGNKSPWFSPPQSQQRRMIDATKQQHDLRKTCWPGLLGVLPDSIEPGPSEAELRSHPEFGQVVLDVNRSIKRFPPGIPYDQRVALQEQLTNLILRVITKYPHLRYYQGYHDVAITILLVVGEEMAFRIMEHLSTEHLRDCMEPTMEKTAYLLNYIYPLIDHLNPNLCDHIDRSSAGTMFCLPWYLTWFGHSLNHYNDVVRLYDFFLASPPLMPLYLTAAIVHYREKEVLAADCNMASIHVTLSDLPDFLPFEELIVASMRLYKEMPPEDVETQVALRIKKEKEQREREDAARKAMIAARRGRENRHGGPLRRQFDRLWRRPNSRAQLILLAVSVAVGLYAYISRSTDFPPGIR